MVKEYADKSHSFRSAKVQWLNTQWSIFSESTVTHGFAFSWKILKKREGRGENVNTLYQKIYRALVLVHFLRKRFAPLFLNITQRMN